MKFPFLCLLCYDEIYTLRMADAQEVVSRINTAARVLCYMLCYLLSLLWEVDL